MFLCQRKRFICLFVCFSLLLCLFPATALAADGGDTVIRVFHTNDVHSRYAAAASDSGQLEQFGYAKIRTLIDSKSSGADRVLVFDAGDVFHGQPFATLNRGESIARLMNAVGYDAMVAGNHDFNYGAQRTMELSGIAGVKLLGANVKNNNGKLALGFSPYTVYDVKGIKVGVFGVSTPETAYKTNPKNVEGIKFTSPILEAREVVKTLRETEKADVVICLSHLGIDPDSGNNTSTALAQEVDGIDLIIDGHSHSAPELYQPVNNTVITSTGEYTQYLGQVDIRVSPDKAVTVTPSPIKAADYNADSFPGNTGVQKMIDQIKAEQAPLLEKVVSSTPIKLDGEREQVRTGETNLSRLITSAMLDETGADVALTNGGGIRASIDAGDITVGDVQTVLPFGNYIVTVKVTGKALREAIEHGLPGQVSGQLEQLGSCAQFAGLEVTYNPGAAQGSRIVSITHNGTALDDAREYLVATNDFMAIGGDDYTMLKQPVVNEFSALDEAVISYLNRVGRAGIEKSNSETRVTIAG